MNTTRRLVSLVALVLLAACGGGGGHGSGPTAPPQGATIVAPINLSVLSGAGLLSATVSLDGQKIGEGDWPELPSGCGVNCFIQGSAANVSSGAHTLTVTVVKIAGARGTYLILGLVAVTPAGGTTRQIDLPRKDVALQAGGKVDYPITI